MDAAERPSDMLDKKMFSLNEAITAYAKEHPETDPNRE